MAKMTRVQFDLTEEALEQFSELQAEAGASTRAELVRNALCLYAWHIEHKAKGHHLIIKEVPDELPPV